MRIFLLEFWKFGLKQAWACLFGAYLLVLILLTKVYWPFESFYRYDFLFIAALSFQALLLLFKLENFREAAVILIFHLVATLMELFKTSESIASWSYQEVAILSLGNVPLFAGFMYSAVGSYLARVWRIFDFQFSHYPPLWTTFVLAALIYINFFTHHYTVDIRYALLIFSALIYGRTWVHFKIRTKHRKMPLLLGFALVTLFIWFAENIGTYSKIWLYPSQEAVWHWVSLGKFWAWFLLMMVSFVLVSLVNLTQLQKDN